MRSLIARLKMWWQTTQTAQDNQMLHEMLSMQRDISHLQEEFTRFEMELDTKQSSSYARVAERQLDVCNRQIETHADVIRELTARWRIQVADLKDQLNVRQPVVVHEITETEVKQAACRAYEIIHLLVTCCVLWQTHDVLVNTTPRQLLADLDAKYPWLASAYRDA